MFARRIRTFRSTDDLLFLNECCFRESGCFKPPPLLAGPKNEKSERPPQLRERLERLKQIESRYAESTNAPERELRRIAAWIAQQWN
jgi:hypothetical protein